MWGVTVTCGCAQKGMILRQRLRAEDIERRMGDLPCIERRDQRVIVDQRTAPGIDEERPARHLRERVGVE